MKTKFFPLGLRLTAVFILLIAALASAIPAQAAINYADDFNPAPSRFVYALAVQPDGKIVVGGEFTAIAGGRATTSRV